MAYSAREICSRCGIKKGTDIFYIPECTHYSLLCSVCFLLKCPYPHTWEIDKIIELKRTIKELESRLKEGPLTTKKMSPVVDVKKIQFPDCVVCMEQVVGGIFLPCAHIVTCRTCCFLPTIKNCPLCCVLITDRKIVFFP